MVRIKRERCPVSLEQRSMLEFFPALKEGLSNYQEDRKVKDGFNPGKGYNITVPIFQPRPISRSAQSFSAFTKLPLEVQDLIWHHAVNGIEPRLVKFRAGEVKSPSLASTCQASRRALEKSSRYIKQVKYPNEFEDGFAAYVDYATDVILLERTDYRYFPLAKIAALREAVIRFSSFLNPAKKLAISVPEGALDELCMEDYSMFWRLLSAACPRLEKLVFVCNRHEGEGLEGLVEVKGRVKPLCFIAEMERSVCVAKKSGLCVGLEMSVMCFHKGEKYKDVL